MEFSSGPDKSARTLGGETELDTLASPSKKDINVLSGSHGTTQTVVSSSDLYV